MLQYIKQKKKQQKKDIHVSVNLFAQKGFNATSMREIGEAIGIKKSSLYSHYKSKDERLEKIRISNDEDNRRT